MCKNTGWKSVMLTTPVDTHPAEWHDVESVATAIDFIKEITVGEMRCVVYLQLTAGVPEGPKEIIFKNFYNTTGHSTAHKQQSSWNPQTVIYCGPGYPKVAEINFPSVKCFIA